MGEPLRIAVPKGALFEDGVTVLEGAGLDVGDLRDPGRQLIVETDDARFVISRPSDIASYVAYGAVDVGIVGKDVLLESDLDVVELADLGFGACRFVVVEPRERRGDALEHYRHVGVMTVATKYPRVTERYFAEKGLQVEIVKLHGNIELAPLIGLADRVVDITSTGRTLEENDLVIVDEVASSSARFVANPIGLRVAAERVDALTEGLIAASERMVR